MDHKNKKRTKARYYNCNKQDRRVRYKTIKRTNGIQNIRCKRKKYNKGSVQGAAICAKKVN